MNRRRDKELHDRPDFYGRYTIERKPPLVVTTERDRPPRPCKKPGCGAMFKPASASAKYCPDCRGKKSA